jgi:hypothetical protein
LLHVSDLVLSVALLCAEPLGVAGLKVLDLSGVKAGVFDRISLSGLEVLI